MYYFAYGSNMNPDRLNVERDVHPTNSKKGVLKDYQLVFNKFAYGNPLITVANIEKAAGKQVEGIVFTITQDELKKIDKFEHYPEHYDRKEVYVLCDGKILNAITYIAKEVQTSTNKNHPTDKKYFDHLKNNVDGLVSKKYLNVNSPKIIQTFEEFIYTKNKK